MEGVEKARARVRELTPLIFCFDLPIIPSYEPAPDPNDPCVRTIQDQYNIQVSSISVSLEGKPRLSRFQQLKFNL